MKVGGGYSPGGLNSTPGWTARLAAAIGVAACLVPVCGFAGPKLAADNPTEFFTNVASALLKSDLNLPLNQIQIYPANQYTPAVHRVLQVSANLYDAATNRADTPYPFLPTAFRPLFRRDISGAVWIAGYREVPDAQMADPATAPAMIDVADAVERSNIPLLGTPFDPDDHDEPMIYGVPLIVGAKKGFPNFNKFALENTIRVTRALRFHRPVAGQPVNETNQIYSLAVSNAFGVQAWNSYGVAFPRDLRIVVAGDVTVFLTNEFGLATIAGGGVVSNRFFAAAITNVPAATWLGYTSLISSSVSFVVPLVTNSLFLPNSAYLQDSPSIGSYFVAPPMSVWDPTNTFRVPHWWLNVRSRLRFALVDTASSPNRIVDYVNLDSSEGSLDIMYRIQVANVSGFNTGVAGDPDPAIVWQTNRLGDPTGQGPDNPLVTTYGILNQVRISLGSPPVSVIFWKKYNANTSTLNDKNTAIDEFTQRLFPGGSENDVLTFDAPFQPTRTYYQYVQWEANDPLVHYTVADLIDRLVVARSGEWDANTKTPLKRLIAANPLSDHYRPWGGNPYNPFPTETSPPTQVNPAVKDPRVFDSDDWNFPTGEPLSFATLGRIHRGTPWQTVYLKSLDVSSVTWSKWTGNTNVADAMLSRPVIDSHLVDLFDSRVNTNDVHQRLSVNAGDTNAWLEALDGMLVLTNSSPPVELTMTSNSPQAAVIAAAIARTRSTRPDQKFHSVGEIVGTPELSTASPWLFTNNVMTMTDDAYERIPTQLLPLVRVDSVGAVTLTNGQVRVQFTGYDDYPYAVEVSSNLFDWAAIGSFHPTNGVFNFTTSPLPGDGPEFYRSKLLP